jgi:hypothetical protein
LRIARGDARPREVSIEPLLKIYDSCGHHHLLAAPQYFLLTPDPNGGLTPKALIATPPADAAQS